MFEQYITGDDRLDIEIEVEAGKVLGFTVNYRARIDGRWEEVVRYDTAHGHLHVHRFWRPEGEQVEALDDPNDPKGVYNADLDAAEEDLVENWRTYRRRMERNLK